MLGVAHALKEPLHLSTQYALGRHIWAEDSPLPTQSNLAHAVVFGIATIPSAALWFIGDFLEFALTHEASFDDKVVINISDEKTLGDNIPYKGFSLSTFQNTSDPEFCKNSNWGGRDGVGSCDADILNPEHTEQICKQIQDAGGNTLRFSIEMCDVMGDEAFDKTAFERYTVAMRTMIKSCIKPMITLQHFVSPNDTFWEDASNIEKYVNFVKGVATRLIPFGDMTYFTFNEVNVQQVMGNIMSDFPPYVKMNPFRCATACRNMYEAHIKAREVINGIYSRTSSTANVGMTHQALHFLANHRFNYVARAVAYVMTYFFHDSFMQWAERNKDKIDLLGIQFYCRPKLNWWLPATEDFRHDPAGILPVLQDTRKRLPHTSLIVTETGSPNQAKQKDYYEISMRAVRAFGDVTGYLGWTFANNFEWQHGYSDKYQFGVRDNHDAMAHIAEVFKNTSNKRALSA